MSSFSDSSGHSLPVERFAPEGAHLPPRRVLLLHGRDGPQGIAGDRSYSELGKALADLGYCVLMPHYFERTKGCGYAIASELDQLGLEVEKYGLWLEALQELLSLENGSFGLWGFSLGGYLALTLAMHHPQIHAVAVCYSGYPAPFVLSAPRLPPTLILHGNQDSVIPVEEAHRLVDCLHRHQIPHQIHFYPQAGHGFCGADAEDAIVRISAFFDLHL